MEHSHSDASARIGLGISSFTYGWSVGAGAMDARSLVARAAEFGLRRVQFGDNLAAETFSDEDLGFLPSCGMTVELGARGLTLDRAIRYVELCRRTGAPLLRFVIDGPGYEPSEGEVTRILLELLPRLADAGVTLGIETHDRWTAAAYRRVVASVGHPLVGICLDTANSLGAGEGLGEVLAALAPFCVNLHVKDFAVRRLPHLMGFTVGGRPAGQGMLDLPALLDAITPHRRCLSATLELWTVPETNPADTLRKEQRWAEESIRFLKPFFN